MRSIYITLLALSLSSCVVTKGQKQRFCNNNCKAVVSEQVRDSIYVRDTVVEIKPDSSQIEALLECDSLGNVRLVEMKELEGKLVKLQTSLKDNRIKTTAKIDTVKVYVKGNTEVRIREKKIEVEKLVYVNPWWKYPLLIWAAFTTLIVAIKFRNPIFGFIKSLL